MSNELTVVDQEVQVLPDYAILNPEIPMSQKVEVATNVANTLAPLVRDQGLSVKGLNKKAPEKEYVTVEGWEVLGTMLGIVPVTTIVENIKNKRGDIVGYKARATLYRNPIIQDDEIVGGTVIARAEAQADKTGFQKDLFAIASMAQTRALGKAYRMGLSWIIKMAGFEPTFAEDMPKFNPQNYNYEPAPMSRSKPERDDGGIIDVTPESANVVDEGVDVQNELNGREEAIAATETITEEGNELYFEELIQDYCEKLYNKQLPVTKGRVIACINKSDLSVADKKLFKEYIKNNWRRG